MRASSSVVEGNKVRLSVEVDEPEVDKVLDDAVRTLSRQARVPGFRPGKVPRQVLEARMGGAGALRAEALKEAIPDFYARALAEAEIDPISTPEIDITAGEDSGALTFDALVEVRPVVAVPGYGGLRVTIPSPVVADADVDAQIDRLRETDAELVTVERAARDGDNVTVDLHATAEDGTEVLGSDDVVYEVGSGRVVPELDDQLRGAKVGAILGFDATPPGGDGPTLSFRVLVKEVQEKRLPDATDAWAADASEFDTLEALRRDLATRLGRVKVVQAQLALRDNTMAALIELVDDDEVPESLVEEELRQRVQDLGHRLEEQRIPVAQFLEATGRSEEGLLEELRAEARQGVKGDLALRAVAEHEGLDVTEEELESELAAMGERLGIPADQVRDRLTRAGRMAAVRSEQRKAKALTWLLDNVELVDEEGHAVSRDDLRADQGDEAMGVDDEGTAARRDAQAADGPAGNEEQPAVGVSATDATDGEAEA